MKISACIITKNEEKNIKHCIESIKAQVDEIIVVDTGSIDNTVIVAMQNGAKVFHRKWQNDFSIIRNFALEQAIGEWILFLDADEILLVKSMSLKELLANMAVDKDAILMKLMNIDVDKDNKEIDYFYTIRIFRNYRGLFYRGKIHEQLQFSDQRELKLARLSPDNGEIYHTGYSTNCIKEKCQRNLKMLAKELLLNRENILVCSQIAECYVTLDEYAKALPYLRKVWQIGRITSTYRSRFYHMYLVTLRKLDFYQTKEYDAVLAEAVKVCSQLPDFHAEMALKLFNKADYQAANEEIIQALTLHQDYQGTEPSFFTQNLIVAQELKTKIENKLRQLAVADFAKSEISSLMLTNDVKQSFVDSKNFIAIHIQELFLRLIDLNDWHEVQQYRSALPEAMEKVIHKYYEPKLDLEVDQGVVETLAKYMDGRLDQRLLVRYKVIYNIENGEKSL